MMRVLTLRRRSGERDVPTILVRSESWSVRRALRSCNRQQGLQSGLDQVHLSTSDKAKSNGRAVSAPAEVPFQSLDGRLLLKDVARLFKKHQFWCIRLMPSWQAAVIFGGYERCLLNRVRPRSDLGMKGVPSQALKGFPTVGRDWPHRQSALRAGRTFIYTYLHDAVTDFYLHGRIGSPQSFSGGHPQSPRSTRWWHQPAQACQVSSATTFP